MSQTESRWAEVYSAAEFTGGDNQAVNCLACRRVRTFASPLSAVSPTPGFHLIHICVTHALDSCKHSRCPMVLGASGIPCTEFTSGGNRLVIRMRLQEVKETRKPVIGCLAYAAEIDSW
jgi:hypothetical protein